ncbi:hypothetical protein RCL1_003089 [Eukaryota sp. TZLM3-RCL]
MHQSEPTLVKHLIDTAHNVLSVAVTNESISSLLQTYDSVDDLLVFRVLLWLLQRPGLPPVALNMFYHKLAKISSTPTIPLALISNAFNVATFMASEVVDHLESSYSTNLTTLVRFLIARSADLAKIILKRSLSTYSMFSSFLSLLLRCIVLSATQTDHDLLKTIKSALSSFCDYSNVLQVSYFPFLNQTVVLPNYFKLIDVFLSISNPSNALDLILSGLSVDPFSTAIDLAIPKLISICCSDLQSFQRLISLILHPLPRISLLTSHVVGTIAANNTALASKVFEWIFTLRFHLSSCNMVSLALLLPKLLPHVVHSPFSVVDISSSLQVVLSSALLLSQELFSQNIKYRFIEDVTSLSKSKSYTNLLHVVTTHFSSVAHHQLSAKIYDLYKIALLPKEAHESNFEFIKSVFITGFSAESKLLRSIVLEFFVDFLRSTLIESKSAVSMLSPDSQEVFLSRIKNSLVMEPCSEVEFFNLEWEINS